MKKEEPTFENSIDNTMNIISIANSMFGKKEGPKQETLEEAAENYVNNFEHGIAHPRRVCKNAFINGAKSDSAKEYWFDIFKKEKNEK